MSNHRLAIVTRALAPYHQALQEALAAEAAVDGAELRLFFPEGTATVFNAESMVAKGENVSAVHVPSIRLPSALFRTARVWQHEHHESRFPGPSLWRELSRFDPTVVWVHEYSPYCLAALLWARWHRRLVVVSSEVGRTNRSFFLPRTYSWHQFWGGLADGFLACSPAATEPPGWKGQPVISVFHAADSRKLQPQPNWPPKEQSVVTFVQSGRVVPRKGADLLLAALARLRDAGRNHWRLILLGPDAEGWGMAQINKYRLQEYVSITGHLEGEQLWQVFGQADVFVLATRQDTYAAVVHEAACLGLPLLVSRHAGAALALVDDGNNGYVIDPADSETFSERLARMMDDPSLRQKMALESRRTGEKYSAHVRAAELWQWLKKL